MEEDMKKTIEKIWQDVIDRKAVAFNEAGCSVNGEAARSYSPYSDWKVCYLDRIAAYYLSDGIVEDVEFD